MDGALSLCEYPHGCCEQLYASTLPNLVLYEFLKGTGRITPVWCQKLLKNITEGQQMLIKTKWNQNSGGFGFWDPSRTSVFHSALVLGLFGQIKSVVSVDQSIIDKTKEYIFSHQLQDGSFALSFGNYTPFPSLLSPLATSVYVFQSFGLAEIQNEKLLSYLISNYMSYKSDSTLISMVLQGLTIYPGQADFRKEILHTLLSQQLNDGSWANNSKSTLTTSQGSTETTAYALVAINKTLFDEQKVADASEKGVEYLLSKRSSKGWESTRDTLYNILAFSSIPFLKTFGGPLSGTITYKLNDQLISEWTTSADSNLLDLEYQLRHYVIPYEKLTKGENVLEVSCPPGGQLVIDRTVYPPYEEIIKAHTPIGTLSLTHSSSELLVGQKNTFQLEFNPETKVEALMVEVPIPSGFTLVGEETLDVLRESNKGFDHFEMKQLKGEQRLCCHASLVTEKLTLQGSIYASFEGDFTMNNPIAYPMYQPDMWVNTLPTKFIVKAQ
eukprot:TRINITY_DN18574_c0_g1_i1.p1 TRINITY_DN18574_c0_g1~~TRINITY_DN18574_c0_g1_i1.p1  ORF type:complete len:558 (+),score=99.80 TRINITY_DN18574_c0_g1_i1:183-1676(+)